MENNSLEEIEQILGDILPRCDLDEFLDVETIKMWMTELDEKGDMSYITMAAGLLDDITELDKELVDRLIGAMIRLRHLLPCHWLGGSIPEELENKRNKDEPITLHISEMAIPPMEWRDDYEDAMYLLHERRFVDAADRFEDAFSSLMESRTTWRDIYRLYCNAGLSYLFSGQETLGVLCLGAACELNPNYAFARQQLNRYREGEMSDLIKLGVIQQMNANISKWKERAQREDHLDPDKVRGWPESRIIKKLQQFGVSVDRERFRELAGAVYSPEDIARELFYPQSTAPERDEDFIWMAAYGLWEIYCPDEPSTSMLNNAIENAADFISEVPEGAVGPSEDVEAECSGHLDRIRSLILSSKEGFLEHWSRSYECVTEFRDGLRYFLTALASFSAFEEAALALAEHLRDRIPHPDWDSVEMVMCIRRGDPRWKIIYDKLRAGYPFHCYTASDVAQVFEGLDDPEGAEKYLLEALEIVDARAENEAMELETTPTTMYDDYKYILDRLSELYGRTGADDTKLDAIEAKRKAVEERSDVYSASPREEEINKKFGEVIAEIEENRASASTAMRYYEYLQRYRINFKTREDVPTRQGQIRVQAEDCKPGRERIPEKIKGETKGGTRKKKKIGRNSPCPCGSGKKYKKCCMNLV